MVGVKMVGVKELKRKLAGDAQMKAAKRIMQKNGAELQAGAQRNAPVDTGNLKRSIGLEIRDDGLTAEVEATADYAPYVEWGTRFMKAQPFVRPAFNTQKEKFKQDMDRLVR